MNNVGERPVGNGGAFSLEDLPPKTYPASRWGRLSTAGPRVDQGGPQTAGQVLRGQDRPAGLLGPSSGPRMDILLVDQSGGSEVRLGGAAASRRADGWRRVSGQRTGRQPAKHAGIFVNVLMTPAWPRATTPFPPPIRCG